MKTTILTVCPSLAWWKRSIKVLQVSYCNCLAAIAAYFSFGVTCQATRDGLFSDIAAVQWLTTRSVAAWVCMYLIDRHFLRTHVTRKRCYRFLSFKQRSESFQAFLCAQTTRKWFDRLWRMAIFLWHFNEVVLLVLGAHIPKIWKMCRSEAIPLS